MTRTLGRRSRRQRGWASAMVVLIILICAAIAGAAVFQNAGARREAEAVLSRERAFQAAEAGCDWGLMRLRASHGAPPALALEVVPMDPTAKFTVRFTTGRTDGIDDDGDGTVDELDEADFSVATSTGESGGVKRTLQLLLKKMVSNVTFPAATHLADPTPVIDVKGAAFRVSGEDHFLDGTVDPSRPTTFGISSPATPGVLAAQIPAPWSDQITGTGGLPSVGQSSAVDLDTLIDQAKNAAGIIVPSGTVTNAAWGTPTPDGVEVVRCDGDLHVSGALTGAGVLVVDGDLIITGQVTWVGIILVRGGVRFAGGGATKRLIGAMACSDEISNDSLVLAGTVDLLYSSDGVALATQALATPVPVLWRETGSP